MEKYVEKLVDYLIYIVGESANPQKIENNIELYASEYVDYYFQLTPQERFEVVEKAIKEYKEL